MYPAIVLEHRRRPHNFRVLETANRKADGDNPLCGDRLTLYVEIRDEVIRDASFQGSGCAISQASASLLTDAVKGKTVSDARELIDRFERMDGVPPELSAPAGIRMECASLAWQTLAAALK